MTTRELLRLIKSGRYEEEIFDGPTLTLVSRREYTERDEGPLNAFLNDLASRTGMRTGIIGGGFGCSITRIAIYTENTRSAIELIDYLKCYDKDNVHTQALSIDVILLPQQKLEYFPRDGRISSHPMNQNITINGNVSNSNFSGRDTKITNQYLSDLLTQMESGLGADGSLSSMEREELLKTTSQVRKELETGNVRKEVVKPLLDTLAKLASIASLVINFRHALQAN